MWDWLLNLWDWLLDTWDDMDWLPEVLGVITVLMVAAGMTSLVVWINVLDAQS